MWARKFNNCIICGLDTRPHMAKGKCSYCYSSEYQNNPKNIDRVKQQKHNHYEIKVGPSGNKIAREERWFSGHREEVLKRDNYKCLECGETDLLQLIVHHVDGNGRGSENPNNVMSNLATWCRACHAKHHATSNGWSRWYAHCQLCKTTERKHNAKGLCWKCYLNTNSKKTL